MALLETLTDTFTTPPLDSAKWVSGGGDGTFVVSGGTLNLTVAGAASTAQVDSVNTYQFANSYILAKVVHSPVAANQMATLAIRDSVMAQEYLSIFADNTTLYLRAVNASGTMFRDSTVAYNATQMAWWRIRHTSGVAYWETSPDAYTWTIQAQNAYTPTSTAFRARLIANRFTGGTFTSTFDNINIIPPYTATLTPTGINDTQTIGSPNLITPDLLLEALHDDFDGTTLDGAKWAPYVYSGSTATVGNGVLTATVPSGANAGIDSAASLVLSSGSTSAFSVKVVGNSVSQPNIRITDAASSAASWMMLGVNNNIYMRVYDKTGASDSDTLIAYDPIAHAYWRMTFTVSGLNVTTVFATSADGITWANRRTSTAKAWASTKVKVRVYAANSGATPVTATFDKVNLPPDYIDNLTDDFNGTTLDTSKWTNLSTGAGTATVANGVLSLTSGTTAGPGGAIKSKPWTFATGSGVSTKVTYDQNSGTAASIYLRFRDAGAPNCRSEFRIYNNTLYVYAIDSAGSVIGSNSVAYSPVSHAFLRLRFGASGATFFDASPDGRTWTQLFTYTTPWTAQVATVELLQTSEGGSNRTATFDKVNLPPDPLIETLTDDFPGTTLDTSKWINNSTGGGTVVVTGGVLELHNGASGIVGRVVSVGTLTIGHSSYVSAKVTHTPGGVNRTEMVLTDAYDSVSFARWRIEGATLLFEIYSKGIGTTVYTGTYNATTHAYLRVRFEPTPNPVGVRVYLDTSPDGVVWTQRGDSGATAYAWTSLFATVALRNHYNGDTVDRPSTFDKISMSVPPTMASLADDFLGPTLDPKWTFSGGGGNYAITNGQLNLNPVGNQTQIETTDVLSLLGGGTFYTRITPPGAAGMAIAGIRLTPTSGSGYAQMHYQNARVYVQVYDNAGNNAGSSNVAYSSATFLYFRIRVDPGATYFAFEYSADGATWTFSAGYTSTGWGRSVRARAYINGNAGNTATFHSINMLDSGGDGTIARIQDDFPGTTVNARWQTGADGSNVPAVADGCLVLKSTTASPNSYSMVNSATAYNVAGSWVSAKIRPSANPNVATELRLAGASPATMGRRAGYLGYYDAGSAWINIAAYNENTMLYWRISVSTGGTATFQYSPDNLTWTSGGTKTAGTGTASVQVSTANNAYTTAGTSYIDAISMGGTGTFPPRALIESLTDTFATTTLDLAKWTTANQNSGSVTVGGGNATLAISSASASSQAYLQSADQGHQIFGSSFSAKVTPAVGAVVLTSIALRNTLGGVGAFELMVAAGILRGNAVGLNCTFLYQLGTYNPVTMAYWRIRFDTDGTGYFGWGPDGRTWTEQKTFRAVWTNGGVGYSAINCQSNGTALTAAAVFRDINAIPAPPACAPAGIIDGEIVGSPAVAFSPPVNPAGIVDPETLGGPSITGAFWATPASLVDPEVLDGPKASVGYATTPAEIGDAETLGEPEATFVLVYGPETLQDPDTLGLPALSITYTASPDGITDPDTVNNPWAGTKIVAAPEQIRDDDQFGLPNLVWSRQVAPDSLADPEILEGPTVYGPLYPLAPGEIADPETIGAPALTVTPAYLPVGLTNPESVGSPSVLFVAPPPYPQSINDPQALGTPSIRFNPNKVNPAGINDLQSFGSPTLAFVSYYNGCYSTGYYGVGLYQGVNIGPASLIDYGLHGEPAINTVPVVGANTLLPLGIHDPETLGEPIAPRTGATNYHYGAGIYNEGIYNGVPGTVTDDNPRDNLIYSSGTYNVGIYYGETKPAPPQDSLPLFRNISGRVQPPMHLLGIGPWSPTIPWRGVPNYGIGAGTLPARPALALPPATSKGFTLRLGAGGEARCELAFPRGSAVIIDEMDTDLWWRRKDPRTQILEMIGRFNTAHVSMSTSDTGVNASIQFVDYTTILGDRMVLEYLHPKALPNPETMWNIGTPVSEILAWALPDNTRLDLDEVKGANPYDLGKITRAFHLPPGTAIDDVMANLLAVSPFPWEWWIETPLDINKAPKLHLLIGERGADKGVVLFDVGQGPTPIASWTRVGAADDYANSLYYTGGGTGEGADAGGGVVENIPADIDRYGQRDTQYTNASIGGNIQLIRTRAQQKLQKLSDRRPSYTIRLRQGFWRGRNHIDVGDTITLYLRLGKDVLRDKYRVSEINVDIDENNLEEVTLNLGRLPTSADPRSRQSPLIRILRYLKNYSTPPGALDLPEPDNM